MVKAKNGNNYKNDNGKNAFSRHYAPMIIRTFVMKIWFCQTAINSLGFG